VASASFPETFNPEIAFCGAPTGLVDSGCWLAGKPRAKINPYPNMIQWNEQFMTGSSQLDQQHRMLINNVNHLEGMLTITNPTREECEFVIHLVDFLDSYATTHFEFEEQCMERYRCPAHQKNKLAHEQFRGFFQNFKERYKAEGFRREVILSLHQVAKQWIEEHILQVDTQLRPCIKG
jgi:hemerythrin